jgi:GMP synthase (glutamine-hydrolysing)
MSTRRTAVVVRHVHFQDLGMFGPALQSRGYDIRYCEVGIFPTILPDPIGADLLVVLGGPINAYDAENFPFIREEINVLKRRTDLDRPTFGIGLGAQLMARALGAKVYPSRQEIGFRPLILSPVGRSSPLGYLEDVPVLHWHGDAFDLPDRAALLASTPACRNQAFSIGPNIMGIQFHAEVDAAEGIEPWLVGHAVELVGADIDIRALRREAYEQEELGCAAREMFEEWLHGLEKTGAVSA